MKGELHLVSLRDIHSIPLNRQWLNFAASTRRSSEANNSTRSKHVSDLRGADISPARGVISVAFLSNLKASLLRISSAGSYDSDEGSARIRFLRLKKKKEEVEVATRIDSSSSSSESEKWFLVSLIGKTIRNSSYLYLQLTTVVSTKCSKGTKSRRSLG